VGWLCHIYLSHTVPTRFESCAILMIEVLSYDCMSIQVFMYVMMYIFNHYVLYITILSYQVCSINDYGDYSMSVLTRGRFMMILVD